MPPVIEIDGVVKRYGDVTAVDGVTLRVDRGEIYGFLGLNGAGKTTTIRLLLGLVKPTSGTARVLGTAGRGRGPKPWAAVGYSVEATAAYPELTVRENLDSMRRLRPGTHLAAVDRVIERLDLTAYANRPAGTLSHGNARRLGLAKALLHTPQVLVLDEPANGLDPAGIVEVRNLLLELASQQGVAVFMSSHNLTEVAQLANRIGIIHHGRLLHESDAAELVRERRSRLQLRTRHSEAACTSLRKWGYDAELAADSTVHVSDPAAIESPDDICRQLVQAGHAPTLLAVQDESLEEYFLRLVGTAKPSPSAT